MYALSERLSLIVSLIPEGSAVCDVGTDHGRLPAALALSGRMRLITATDINEKPLRSAQRTLDSVSAEGVRLVLCDGLEGVSREEADVVVIAGMGGEVISGIISRCSFIKQGVTLILQPMTAAGDLRRYLAENGFCIKSEHPLSENGKIYSVMVASFDGVYRSFDEAELLVGSIMPDTPAGRLYIKKQLRICQSCADKLSKVKGKECEALNYKKTANKIASVLEGKNGI